MSPYEMNVAEVVRALRAVRIVPVLAIENVEDGVRLCKLLETCGLLAAEITFRTRAAGEIIRRAARETPRLLLGAGTVLNRADLHEAFRAGARFAVAPGFNPEIVREAVDHGYAFSPGIMTPTEMEQAMNLGVRVFKFCPAEICGGVKMLKFLCGPYQHLGVQFMPTGGITRANAPDYLKIPQVVAVGGTWLGKAEDLAAGRWEAIETEIRATVELVKNLAKA